MAKQTLSSGQTWGTTRGAINSNTDELYSRVNQGVKTTDSPEFAGLTINGNPVSTAQYNDIGIAGKQ